MNPSASDENHVLIYLKPMISAAEASGYCRSKSCLISKPAVQPDETNNKAYTAAPEICRAMYGIAATGCNLGRRAVELATIKPDKGGQAAAPSSHTVSGEWTTAVLQAYQAYIP